MKKLNFKVVPMAAAVVLVAAAVVFSSPAMAEHSICSDIPNNVFGHQTCVPGEHEEDNTVALVLVIGLITWAVVREVNRPKDKPSSFSVTPQFATDTKNETYGLKFEFSF